MIRKFSATTRLMEGNKMSSQRITKADVIKRLMKEQKAAFGKLLETKSEKLKRLQRESATGRRNTEDTKNSNDGESSWMLKVSSHRLKQFHVNVEAVKPEVVQRERRTKSSGRRIEEPKRISSQGSRSWKLDTKEDVFFKSLSDAFLVPSATVTMVKHSCFSEATPLKTIKPNSVDVEKKAFPMEDEQNSEMPIKPEILKPPTILKKIKNILSNIEGAQIIREKITTAYDSQASEILSLPIPCDEETLKLPSTTKILNATMSPNDKLILERWISKMIEELGHEGFQEYRRDLLDNGKLLHSTIDAALRKLPYEVPSQLELCFNSLQSVFEEIKDVRSIESHVAHPDLGYRGILDCVATYRDTVCVIDWKKSDQPKKIMRATYDAPLQLASYIGALNADKNYPYQIKHGIIVIAYTKGTPPTLFQLDETRLDYYWKKWLERLKQYYTMLEKNS